MALSSTSTAYPNVLAGIGQQRHVSRALDRYSHLALQFGISTRFAARANAAVIADKVAQAIHVFPIYLFNLDGANSAPALKIATSFVEAAAPATLSIGARAIPPPLWWACVTLAGFARRPPFFNRGNYFLLNLNINIFNIFSNLYRLVGHNYLQTRCY
jgi:hypothetical protein